MLKCNLHPSIGHIISYVHVDIYQCIFRVCIDIFAFVSLHYVPWLRKQHILYVQFVLNHEEKQILTKIAVNKIIVEVNTMNYVV
jgi:hypothetical protein